MDPDVTLTLCVFVGKDEDDGMWTGHDDPEVTLNFISYQPPSYLEAEMTQRSREFYELMCARRSVRMFSDRPVPLVVMENIVRTAGQFNHNSAKCECFI